MFVESNRIIFSLHFFRLKKPASLGSSCKGSLFPEECLPVQVSAWMRLRYHRFIWQPHQYCEHLPALLWMITAYNPNSGFPPSFPTLSFAYFSSILVSVHVFHPCYIWGGPPCPALHLPAPPVLMSVTPPAPFFIFSDSHYSSAIITSAGSLVSASSSITLPRIIIYVATYTSAWGWCPPYSFCHYFLSTLT